MTSLFERIGDDNIMYVVSCMLSIELYKKRYGCLPPAAMDSEIDLLFWAENMRNFKVQEITTHSSQDAVCIVDPDGYYEAVWVRAGYKEYRKVLVWHGKTYGATDSSITRLDADHVINRATVLNSFGEDGWMMLFPVTPASNRSFGSAIEKSKLNLIQQSGEISMPALHFMKTHVFEILRDAQGVEAAVKRMAELIMFDTEAEKEELLKKAGEAYLKLRGWT